MMRMHGRLYLLLAGLILASASARAGSIVGTVKAEGKIETGRRGGGAKYESRAFKFLETIDYDQLRDFVVYIESPVKAGEPDPEHFETVIQKNGQFIPHVLPVAAGTAVRWPNRDDIYHNVFSYSEPKPFDLGLYKGDRDDEGNLKAVRFDKPGRVDIFCSIHKSMHCIVLVTPNRFFARTDDKGRFSIEGVPAGKYRLRAWHERLPSLVKEITVPEIGEAEVGFTLGVKGLPKY